jgi:hypothetical protein
MAMKPIGEGPIGSFGKPVAGVKCSGQDIISGQQGHAAAHLVAIQPLCWHAETVLQRHIAAKGGDIFLIGQ